MHWIPRVSAWISVPLWFAVSYGLCRLWCRYANQVCAKVYQDCLKGDCRIRLEPDGIVVSGSDTASSISWSAIRDIVVDKDWVTIQLSALHILSFPAATFEGQDVESFADELVRRWAAHRMPADAAA
jgi:hypothetical protein